MPNLTLTDAIYDVSFGVVRSGRRMCAETRLMMGMFWVGAGDLQSNYGSSAPALQNGSSP